MPSSPSATNCDCYSPKILPAELGPTRVSVVRTRKRRPPPGAGGSVYLPRLVGRARALEIVLGARRFDAQTAERYGWINRAVPAAELDDFVDRLARHIAALAPGVAEGVVETVDAALTSHQDGLAAEERVLFKLFSQSAAAALTHAALAAGAQTREGERELETVLDGIAGI